MSNWVLEFDRWAPSVIKIAYKVSFFLPLYLIHSLLLQLNETVAVLCLCSVSVVRLKSHVCSSFALSPRCRHLYRELLQGDVC